MTEDSLASPRPDPDAADVRRVLAGDRAAFADIVNRWQRRLINLAWRFCRDRAMAEDMAQEAFVKAYMTLHTFRGDSEFSTWLIAVALNSYRSWLRQRRPVTVSLEVAVPVDREPSALSRLQEREQADAVRQMVLSLPARYRDALVLFYFEEMSLAAAARVLRVPEGTLKARLARGRELLRRRCAAFLNRRDSIA